jgi:hypothetical protein
MQCIFCEVENASFNTVYIKARLTGVKIIRGPYIVQFLTDCASAAGTTDERNDLVIITLISGLVVCTWLDSYNKVQSALKQIT